VKQRSIPTRTSFTPFAQTAASLRSIIPSGGALPPEIWTKRHRFLVSLTWFHAILIGLVGPLYGYRWVVSIEALFQDDTVLHTVLEGVPVALFAVLGGWKRLGTTLQASAVALGLMSSSAILVHLSGGYIELHFHFFVMLTFLALYQDWIPYLLAIVYVAIHHGLVGVLWPEAVYNHGAALNAPWTWAGIHAFFILCASAGTVISWRFNEIAASRLDLILNSAGEGIFGLDREGKVMFANPAAASILGYSTERLVGQSVEAILHPGKDETLLAEKSLIDVTLQDGSVRHSSEEVFWREDGSRVPVEYISTPILESDDLVGAVVAFEDITERKQTEERLTTKTRDLETLLYLTSHNLREPLRAIAVFSKMVQERSIGLVDDKTANLLMRVIRASGRMNQLLDNVFALSSILRMETPAEQVEARAIVTEALRRCEKQVEERRAKVTVAESLPRLRADKRWASEAVYHLIANALKFTEQGEAPNVEITSYQSDGQVGLVVKDRGPGIPPDLTERIFQMFQRGVGQEIEGAGAGLAIVRQVAEHHGGRAWVQAREGGGSEFFLTFGV